MSLKTLAAYGIMLISMSLYADTETIDGIIWTYTVENGYAVVGDGHSAAIPTTTSGAIAVPDKLGGCEVKSIGSSAFYECKDLTIVTMPDTITNICSYAFCGCSSLTNVTIPENVISIGGYAFYYCKGLTKVTIPYGVTSIASTTFGGCSGLTEFIVSEENKSYCSRNKLLLTKDAAIVVVGVNGEVIIPESVTSIGNYAFYYFNGLKSVKIPDSVTSIGNYGFYGCSGLTSVMIPDSVRSIDATAFLYCSGMTEFIVGENNPSYCSQNGLLLSKDATSVINGINGDVTIPNSVTNIGTFSFGWCYGLTSITIPDNVTSIGNYAFRNCSGLKNVTIPTSVTSIGMFVFYGCTGLTNITMPESVTSIGGHAFRECSGLTSVTIPANVSSIGMMAFYNSSRLTSITMTGAAPTVGNNAFYNVSNDCVVRLPRGNETYTVTDGKWQGLPVVWYGKADETTPSISGDAEVWVEEKGDGVFNIIPSITTGTVIVTIPDSVDASNVTVTVSSTIETVKGNGAAIRVVKDGCDITPYLDIPAADSAGAVAVAAATVKEEYRKEALDPVKGAVIELSDTAAPSLTTSATRPGLTYILREGSTLNGMEDGSTKVGDGQAWSPTITVKGGNSGFYSIKVEK